MNKRQILKLGTALTAVVVLGPTPKTALPPTLASAYRCGGRKTRAVGVAEASAQASQTPLGGHTIAKYVDPLPVFGSSLGTVPGQLNAPRVPGTTITVGMSEIQQKILPASIYAGLRAPYSAGTYVFAYTVGNTFPLYPGVSIEAQVGAPTTITYVNNLPLSPVLYKYVSVDQSLHWANPLGLAMTDPARMTPYAGPPPTVVHLHGAAVSSLWDGVPDGWFTPNGLHGAGYTTLSPTSPNAAMYQYPNDQEATALWFHDHALGDVRTNVYRGLAAFYLLRDQFDTGKADNPLGLPAEAYEREILIQDRQFDTNGQLYFPDGSPNGNGRPSDLNGAPPNPMIHPTWIPEFFGDVMVVNGKSWPYLEVEPRRYRFRLLDGCNARFLRLSLVNTVAKTAGPVFWQIGTDGGLLDGPTQQPNLFLAPAERADVIVDFSAYVGQTLTMLNNANAPYPNGDPPDPRTNGQVMQFRVTLPLGGKDTSYNPAAGIPLRGGIKQMPVIVRLANPHTGRLATGVTPQTRRQLTLVEVEGAGGPIEVLLNNTKWDGIREGSTQIVPGAIPDGLGDYVTESPLIGSTEVWEIINLTEDAHPIHLHLIQFQLISRQGFSRDAYRAKYDSLFPGGTYSGQLANGSWGPVTYPAGAYIPGFGPPRLYKSVNADLAMGGNPAVSPYLQGTPMLPRPEEAGWKDTLKMFPQEVTRIAVRWAPSRVSIGGVTPGQNLYGFDPSAGPGYVWHCHILDHEDNEMMRPLKIVIH